MHVAARNVQRCMMPANSLLVRAVQQAVDLAVAVVEQLNLPHSELINSAVPGPLGYVFDGLRRKLQVIVVIHESRQERPLLNQSYLATLLSRAQVVYVVAAQPLTGAASGMHVRSCRIA